MPDLNMEAVHAFWDSYDRRVLYRVIVAIESIEKWAADLDPEVDQAIIQLGQALDMAKNVDFSGNEEAVINVLAHVRAGRAIRILQSLDMASPGTAAKLLTYAEEHSNHRHDEFAASAKLFLERNLTFERMQLLSRVFAAQRVSLVLNALEQ